MKMRTAHAIRNGFCRERSRIKGSVLFLQSHCAGAGQQNGLQLASDPRIPDDLEVFPFEIQGVAEDARVEWTLNGVTLAQTTGGSYAWLVKRGAHRLRARIHTRETIAEVPEIKFIVK